MNCPKLIFKKASLEKEAERIYNFKQRLLEDFALRKNSIFNIKLEENLKNKIMKVKNFSEISKELSSYLEMFKPSPISISPIEKDWKTLEKNYFTTIQKYTEKHFRFKKYICYLTFSAAGHYREGTNEIYANQNKQPKIVIGICGEELLHLHYWEIVKNLFNVEINQFIKENHMTPWQISEVIPEYLLIENPLLKRIYSNWNRSKSYPWIPELRKTLDPL